MVAYTTEQHDGRQTAATFTARQIVIRNTTPDDVQGMDKLSRLVYNYDHFSRVDEFLSQIRIFPEGQFVALDVTTPDAPQVVGYTSSMRLNFDPARPRFKPWADETGYG